MRSAVEHPVITALKQARLTGRGGAGFPTALKVRALFDHDADLIVNACDGERGAGKDTWVVQHHCEEVRAAVQMLTEGSRRRVWYAAHRGSFAAELLDKAGCPVLEVPPRYVSSESSALVSLAHGGVAKPLGLRQPTVYGGRDNTGRRISPTVVFNIETLWRVEQILRLGAQWFTDQGTEQEPGPCLVAIGGYVRQPVVCQTEAGTPMQQLFDQAGQLPLEVQAVMIGGLSGGFVEANHASQARWATPGLQQTRSSSGVVEVLDPHRCPLMFMGQLLDYAAGESAGQCGPCMFGLPALADRWYDLVMQPSSMQEFDRLRQDIDRRLRLLLGRGACHFPDGVSGWVSSGLAVFGDHLQAHHLGACPIDNPVDYWGGRL